VVAIDHRNDGTRAAGSHVFDWKLPIRVGVTPFVLGGSLDYDPPPKSRFNPPLIIPLAADALAGAIVCGGDRFQAGFVAGLSLDGKHTITRPPSSPTGDPLPALGPAETGVVGSARSA
jgi:hypothetical protein